MNKSVHRYLDIFILKTSTIYLGIKKKNTNNPFFRKNAMLQINCY